MVPPNSSRPTRKGTVLNEAAACGEDESRRARPQWGRYRFVRYWRGLRTCERIQTGGKLPLLIYADVMGSVGALRKRVLAMVHNAAVVSDALEANGVVSLDHADDLAFTLTTANP